ncbi:MAG: hypothetical protein JNK37_11455 [Verrucomicrobiales bacterium]|nr:hypothetical protein [Verrucomicrobiales bacterium]
MKYLLDVNVLVAWGWADHVDHARVDQWLAARIQEGDHELITSAIPELGFVRVSVLRGGGQVTPQQASAVLAGMLQALEQIKLIRSRARQSVEACPALLPLSRTTVWRRRLRDASERRLISIGSRARQSVDQSIEPPSGEGGYVFC